MKDGMKISDLEEILKTSKERLGDVPVYGWNGNTKPFPITGVNNEGDHIELTN